MNENEREPTAEIYLEEADELMYDMLVDEFGEDHLEADLRVVVKERVRQLYDNREAVAENLKESEQAPALGGQ